MASIYKIENKINGKCYVGATTQKPSLRKSQHFHKMRSGQHANHNLRAAYKKYGPHNLIFSVLEDIDEANIKERELFWCNKLNGLAGYNIRPIPESNAGYRHTEETKRKISAALKGRDLLSPELRKQAALKLRGQKKAPHVIAASTKAIKHMWATRREEMIWKCRKLTIANIKWAKKQKSNGVSQAQIARDLGVTPAVICNMLKGKSYAEVL